MIKHVLLAGGMMMAMPTFAQTAPATTDSGAATSQGGQVAPPTQDVPTTGPASSASNAFTGDAISGQTSPATPAPTQQQTPVTGTGTTEPGSPEAAATPTPQATPAPQADAAASTGSTQVSQIVGREFGAYDKNKDGKLSQVEFDSWMVALKTASDPATKADAPATKQWLGAAFAQADVDKSRDLTQAELTGFLSQGQS